MALPELRAEAAKFRRPELSVYGDKHPLMDDAEFSEVEDGKDGKDGKDKQVGKPKAKVESAKPATQASANDAVKKELGNVEDSIAEGSHDTINAIGAAHRKESQQNAEMIRTMYAMDKNLVRINETIGNLYQMFKDEKGRPKLDIYSRDSQRKYNTESGEAEPDDPSKSPIGMIGNLLSGGLAALLGAKAKGILDKIRGRGRVPNPSTLPESERVRTRPAPRGPGTRERLGGPRPTTVPEVERPRPTTIRGKIGEAFGRGKEALSRGATAVSEGASGLKGAVGKAFESARGAKGRAGLILAAGAAGVAGAEYLMGKADEFGDAVDENGRITMEEQSMQSARKANGLTPLEGTELTKFRTNVTAKNGLIPNPNTGFPLNAIQQEAVQKGVMTAEQAISADNKDIYDVMVSKGITVSSDAYTSAAYDGTNVSDEKKGSGSLLTDVAVFGGGAYAAHKGVQKLMGPGNTTPTPHPPEVRVPPTPQAANTVANERLPTTTPDSAGPATERRTLGPRPTPPSTVPPIGPRPTTIPGEVPEMLRPPGSTPPINAEVPRTSALGGLAKGAKKALPIIGTAMTAYDAYNIIQDDKATTGQKAGKLADLGGGTAGAIGGAAAGAAIGSVVPVVGTAIGGVVGGIAGYYGGEKITQGARRWAFGNEDDPKDKGMWGKVKDNSMMDNAKLGLKGMGMMAGPLGVMGASALVDYLGDEKKADASPLASLAAPKTEAEASAGSSTSPRDSNALALAVQTGFEEAFKTISKDSAMAGGVTGWMQSLFGISTPGATAPGQAQPEFSGVLKLPSQGNGAAMGQISQPGVAPPLLRAQQPAATNGGFSLMRQPTTTSPTVQQPQVKAPPPLTISSPNVTAAPAVANVSAKAVNDVQPVRNNYTSVVKTSSVDAPATKERVRSTEAATQSMNSSKNKNLSPLVSQTPRIDDVPSVVNDGHLSLINTGFL